MILEEFDRLVDQNHEKLAEIFAQTHKQLIEATQVFKQALEYCKIQGFNSHAELWNVGIYINLAAFDLSILVQQIYFERDDWKRRQMARHVALTIYEITKDMTKLLGKKVRNPLLALGLLPNFEADLCKLRKPLDRFWDENKKLLSDIRCNLAAHRDLDGLSFLESIEILDIWQIAQLGMELGMLLNEIGRTIQRILNESSEVSPPDVNKTI